MHPRSCDRFKLPAWAWRVQAGHHWPATMAMTRVAGSLIKSTAGTAHANGSSWVWLNKLDLPIVTPHGRAEEQVASKANQC